MVPRQAGEMRFKLMAYSLLFGYKKTWQEDKCNRRKRWGKFIMMTLASLKALISRTWRDIFGFLNTIPKGHCFACRILSGLWRTESAYVPAGGSPSVLGGDQTLMSLVWVSSGRAQWRLHAAWAQLCPWSSQTPVGPPDGSGGLCKWRLLQQTVGDVPVLGFASDGLLPSLKKGCVAAHCGWVSPLSLGSAPSLCQLTQSGGCGHRDASVSSLPAQPDPVGKKLVFVSSCFCVKYLLVCSKDGYFFLLFLSSDPLTTAIRRLAGAGATSAADPVLLCGCVPALLHKHLASLGKHMGNKTCTS